MAVKQRKRTPDQSLALIDRAEQLLAKVDTIQKAKDLKSEFLSLADWARRRRLGEAAVQHAKSFALEAERKMGDMLKATERAKGAREPGVGRRGKKNAVTRGDRVPGNPPTLRAMGIGKQEAAEARMIATLPRVTFEALKHGEITRKAALATVAKPLPPIETSVARRGVAVHVTETVTRLTARPSAETEADAEAEAAEADETEARLEAETVERRARAVLDRLRWEVGLGTVARTGCLLSDVDALLAVLERLDPAVRVEVRALLSSLHAQLAERIDEVTEPPAAPQPVARPLPWDTEPLGRMIKPDK